MNKRFVPEDKTLREVTVSTRAKTPEGGFTTNRAPATNTPKKLPGRTKKQNGTSSPLTHLFRLKQHETVLEKETQLPVEDAPGVCQRYPSLASVRCPVEKYNSPLNYSKTSHRQALP